MTAHVYPAELVRRRVASENNAVRYFHASHQIVGVVFRIQESGDEEDFRRRYELLKDFVEKHREIMPPIVAICSANDSLRSLLPLIFLGIWPLKEIPLRVFLKTFAVVNSDGTEVKTLEAEMSEDERERLLALERFVTTIPLAVADITRNRALFLKLMNSLLEDSRRSDLSLIFHEVACRWLEEIRQMLARI